MTQMTWLKLNRASLDRVPDELSRLSNLEHLQMSRNTLTSVHGELSDLPRLRSVIVRHNQVGPGSDFFAVICSFLLNFWNVYNCSRPVRSVFIDIDCTSSNSPQVRCFSFSKTSSLANLL
uniref:Uncharacterized protein n=1 Tax=Parascaris equorum TaxID=6256 RepID=A0A914RCP2_PAREQ